MSTGTTDPEPNTPPVDGGAVGRLGTWLLGRSWKTSMAGFAVFGLTVIPTVCDGEPWTPKKIATVCGAVAMAVGLWSSKDKGVSGTAR